MLITELFIEFEFELVARVCFSLSIPVRISKHPCKLVGLLPRIYVHIILTLVYVV